MKPSRFFINFLKALGVFIIWGSGTYLILNLLKASPIWLVPYLGWILLGLVDTYPVWAFMENAAKIKE